MSVHHLRVPGDAARRVFAVYVLVARHRNRKTVSFYVGKTGDNRVGCNPMISRAGNHLSFNPLHAQARKRVRNPEQHDFDFFYTCFGPYVPPSRSRRGVDLVNEMERQLNRIAQGAFGKSLMNPLKGTGHVPRPEREERSKLATKARLAQLRELVGAVQRSGGRGK